MTGWILIATQLMWAPAQAAPDKLAIVVSAPELDEDSTFAVETKLLAAAEQIPGVDLVLREETRIHVQAMRAMGDECTSLECLANVGGAANARRVLFANVGARAIEAKLIDVAARAELGAVSTAAPAGVREQTAARVVRALLAPEQTGALVLLVDPEDANVSVDGELVVPGTRIDGLSVGSHTVEASRDGYAPYREELVVTGGGLVPHDVRLTPGAVEESMSPLLIGGLGSLGAAVALGATGIGLAVAPGLMPPSEQRDARQSQARDGTLIASGVLAGGAAVVAVVTGAALTAYSFME